MTEGGLPVLECHAPKLSHDVFFKMHPESLLGHIGSQSMQNNMACCIVLIVAPTCMLI